MKKIMPSYPCRICTWLPRHAKTVTLELYVNKEEKNRTTYKKYETGTEDTYGEGEGRVYESDEDPLDLYSPVEGKIEIKLR